VPIRGEVIYKGAPLTDVTQGLVHYLPKTSEGRQATGRVQPDGTFVLTTFKAGDGVVPGDYDIVISAFGSEPLSREQAEASGGGAGPKLMIPKKYADPKTSGISDTVNADHSGFKRIELTD
jgi:hypothetical protein